MLKFAIILTSAALGLSCHVMAEEHRELGAHEHGHGTLNVAVEGNVLKMELEVPGDDIVGFEHDPSTQEEKAAMESAKKSLADPLNLFKIPDAAKCSVREAKVSIREEKHEDGGAAAKGGAKKDDAKKHDEPEAHHNEFFVEYTLDCKAAGEVKTMNFNYFKVFKKGEELNVSVITPKGATKFEVTRDKPEISLAGLM